MFGGSLFQIRATLFRKKLCLTVTEWEKLLLLRDLNDSL